MIYVVRHGEVMDISRLYGRKAIELSPNGIETSRRVAVQLKDKGLERIVSSPSKRCVYMAEKIAKSTGSDLIVDYRVAAKNYGEWEGISKDQIINIDQGDIYIKWKMHAKGGESFLHVAERVAPFLEEIADKGAAIVTHSSVSKVIYSLVFNDINGINRSFPYGDITEFDIDKGMINKSLEVLRN
ncbi:MAG: histidine phosphatase family protein [Nanoarchaeota archaeon]